MVKKQPYRRKKRGFFEMQALQRRIDQRKRRQFFQGLGLTPMQVRSAFRRLPEYRKALPSKSDPAYDLKSYAPILSFLEASLGKRKGSVLEIGYGDIPFLDILKKNGFKTTGVDIVSPEKVCSAEKARELDLRIGHAGALNKSLKKEDRFDVAFYKGYGPAVLNSLNPLHLAKHVKPGGYFLFIMDFAHEDPMLHHKMKMSGFEEVASNTLVKAKGQQATGQDHLFLSVWRKAEKKK